MTSCAVPTKRVEPIERPGFEASDSPAVPLAPATKSRTPRLGLILGPGGMKTFAHVGVLHELERNRIPIHGIVGLEWGAIVGGLYASTLKSNDTEWKMMKLKKENLPSTSLLKSKIAPAESRKLEPFISDIMGDNEFNRTQVPFACPMARTNGERSEWARTGKLRESILSCAVYPPLFKDNGGFTADPNRVSEAARLLRELGAEVVVLINVLGRGVYLKTEQLETPFETGLLWRDVVLGLDPPAAGVDFVVGVHTRNYDILDFEARRNFLLFGSQAGQIASKQLIEKYGF